MNIRQFYDALLDASTLEGAEAAIADFRKHHSGSISEIPVGGRENNRGAVDVAADAGRSAIERVTNAQDALLELEHQLHKGIPECRSPREAAAAWLNVPVKDGLAGISVKERQDLAQKIVVRMEAGEGKQSRLLSIIDRGIGITPTKLKSTILSLNESNKISKYYLAGTYGQGGSSTFTFSRLSLIASRALGSSEIGFTVVRYLDLPAEQFKTGQYVYLVLGGEPLVVTATASDFPNGTVVRHFGFDLTNYAQPIGPNSLYGALNRIMFDPVSPVRFENRVHTWNRVIKGSRNALNGAEDQGDEARRPDLDHNVPIFQVDLGDLGSVGIEYWVLKRPVEEKGKTRKNPADAFVDSKRPIVLTHNGQNQGELLASILRKEADLPFLKNRLICHVSCDKLSPSAKRLLFSSTREQSRQGFVLARIQDELVSALKADDELLRLNLEARDSTLRDRDESAKEEMKKQVSKLLRIAGAALQSLGGGKTKTDTGDGKEVKRGKRVSPQPIATQDPPTYIKIIWDDEKDIKFYAGQRRYVRIETDANSSYHNSDNLALSRINIATGDALKVFGTSPLKGGRMRIGVECTETVTVGQQGSIRIELYRTGLPAISDEKDYQIVDAPKPKQNDQSSTMPDFEVIEVNGPEDENWEYVASNPEDTAVAKNASGAEMTGGKLLVYYSTQFPRFATEMKRLEQQNPALAKSFKARYELWIAVHSLLLHQDQDQSAEQEDETLAREAERQERCRLGMLATMVALQEVKTGVLTEDADAA